VTTSTDSPIPIAYLTTSYPSVSHTFIRREIQGLEVLGYTVDRISIRPGGDLVDPADIEEEKKTWHVLDQSPISLIFTAIITFLGSPSKAFASLRETFIMSRRSDRGFLKHLAYWFEAGAILPYLKKRNIQHLHVHFGTNPTTVAILIRILGGPPFSFTVHGPDELDGPIGYSLGDKIHYSNFTVAITHFCSSQLRRWIPYSEWDKINIVHCTVGEEWFNQAAPIPESSNTLVCVGRLSEQKGQLVLIEAFSKVIQDGTDGHLVLVGDGPMRAVIEEHIEKNNLQEKVTITGWQSEKEVRQHLLGARSLVLSSFAEGLPVVIMEAMALKRPVISTTINGIPELVHHGDHGWLVIAGDSDDLAETMKGVLQAPIADLNAMGERSQTRVRERHSTNTEVKKLDVLIRQSIEKG
jgi:glycosyltransferase involved in cell wall biosynthesis